jgi:hypothetical protein
MFCHKCISDVTMFTETAGGADLVKAHQPGVPGDISR